MTLYGRTIDAYNIGRLLGRGSFGDVYEAKCQHSGQLVAIKMISKELLHNQGLLERITKEVEIHCQLQHPHIVELYEYFEDDRRVYLVMELCKNGELLALLRKHGRFDAGTARAFFSQLVDGVAYLHSHSILHRDLKLSNLLLSADNTLKIADFGLAAAIGVNDPERRTICGTPNYMCPEIVAQQPYSLAADLWSLGVTLYTLLTGTPPFQSDAVRGTLQRVGCADYLLPRQLPGEAADLISQLLQKNPAQRLSLPAIQSHPFLVGPSKPQATESKSANGRVPQANCIGTAPTQSNLVPASSHTAGQSGQLEQVYEGEGLEERGSGRGNRPEWSGGGPNCFESSEGVQRSGNRGRQQAPRNEVTARSHPREHRSEGQREAQGGRSESTASADRGKVTVAREADFERTTGTGPHHRAASSGFCEKAPDSERSWSSASGARRNGASASERNGTELRNGATEGTSDVRTERQASGTRGCDARPQSSSSRPGTAGSDPGGSREDSQLRSRIPPGATQLPTRPLSTLRLKALRHETSYGSLEIRDDGRVQVRNTGPGGSVLTVSPDGLEVEVEQAGRPKKTYRFPALPDALLMHCAHTAAFVGLVASATPKVIYWFERGQATCMENGDPQVCFTDCSPATLLQVDAASGKVTVTPPSGAPVTVPSLHSRPTDFQASPSSTWQPSPDDTWLWEVLSQARRCQRKCAEAEARAIARHPPKTFPLVARSARLKTVSQRGGVDATVALAAAAPPAEVERAAELVAAVQRLHASLLPANVSVASAQELSFASSSEASSHLQPGPRFLSQPQHAPGPILKRALLHSPSSPLSPSPSLPETPSTRDGGSLERVAERQPFAADGRSMALGHLEDRERRPSGLRHASSAERPAPSLERPKDRRDDLGTDAAERRQGGLERGSGDVIRQVAVDQRVGWGQPAGETHGVREVSAPQGVKQPPRPKRDGSEEPRNSSGPAELGKGQAGRNGAGAAASDVIRQRRDEPARVLADVSNRPAAEARNARRAEKANGERRGPGLGEGGGLDGVRRRMDRSRPAGIVSEGRGNAQRGESERGRLPVIGETFKVFEDREELRPRSRFPEAKLRQTETESAQRAASRDAADGRAGGKLSAPGGEPISHRHTGGERLRQAQAPFDFPSARSVSDTWQDLSATNREPSDFPSAGPSSEAWQHLIGTRRTFPAASPSSDTWHDGRSEDPVLEGLSVPAELRRAERHPAREDARSYVASNRLLVANQGSSVTANRGSSAAPPGPSSSHSPPPSHPVSPLPLSQNTRDFLSRSEKKEPGDPPQLNGAATLGGAERLGGRPGTGPDSENGRQSAYFPGVGWAIRLKSGELLMHYLDDCQMVVSNDGATVEFWPPGAKMGGSKYTLSDRASIPQEVRDKLQYLSAFIKLIRKQSHGTQTYSKWVTPRTSPALTAH